MSLEKLKDKDSQRLVEGWASVEEVDKQGEIIPIAELKKIMPLFMSRGGNLNLLHTNRTIGKILNYEFKIHPVSKTEGLYILSEVFKGTKSDDEVWEKIRKGEIGSFSFAGEAYELGSELVKLGDQSVDARTLKDIDPHEISAVLGPANQFAHMTAINYFAKSEDVQKPFAGFSSFADCVSQNPDKEDPNAYCASVMRVVEKINDVDNIAKAYKVQIDAKKGEHCEEEDETLKGQCPENIIQNKKEDGSVEATKEESKAPEDVSARMARLEENVDKVMKFIAAAETAKAAKADEEKPEDEKKPEDAEDAEKSAEAIATKVAEMAVEKFAKASTVITPRPATLNAPSEELTALSIIEKSHKGIAVDMGDVNAHERELFNKAWDAAGV